MNYPAMVWDNFNPGPAQHLKSLWGFDHLYLKRLDLIDSWTAGNKYYKLKQHLQYAHANGIDTIVSKGGMFSNHLSSLGEACAILGLKLKCIIRSHASDLENPMLVDLRNIASGFIFLRPDAYNAFDEHESNAFYPGALFIPEGGLNALGIEGLKELADECVAVNPTHIIVSGGSMTTACGLIKFAQDKVKLIIVPAWKGCTTDYIQNLLQQFNIIPNCHWEIWPEAHCGGFAKFDAALVQFMKDFTIRTSIPLDPVYTGKMMKSVYEKILADYFSKKDKLLAIHTGGMQGLRGFTHRFPEIWGSYEELVTRLNEQSIT